MNRLSYLVLSNLLVILVFSSLPKSTQVEIKNVTESVVEQTMTIYEEELEETTKKETSFWVITGYCSCAECCGEYSYGRPIDENGNEIVYGASGRQLVPYYSCACDSSIPFGTIMRVCFENGGEIVVEVMDRGGAVNGNHIDLYCYDHEQALSIGKQTVEVEIIEWG